MRQNSRRKVFLILSALILCAGAVLAAATLKGYSHTVPITVGPYRETIFTALLFLLMLSLGFAFGTINLQTILGSVLTAIPVLWFSARKLLQFQSPEHPFLNIMDHCLPAALILFGMGAALWIGSFFKGSWEKIKISETKQLILVLLLMFIILQPNLSRGFYWDDAFFSVEAQHMRLTGESVFARVWKEITDYVRIGRINPFAAFHFLVFYFIPDDRIYKLMLVILTLTDGWLFYRFLRLWRKEDHMAAILSLLIVPLCFQARLYHDPLNSYYGLMQVMFCELMCALITYLHWLRDGKKHFLVLSLLCFSMGLMSYEMFFPFTALFLILAWIETKDLIKAIRRSLPWILLAVLIFGLSMVLRRNITEETAYNGTTFSMDIPLILQTFAKQVGAAFPLSYRNAGYDAGLFGNLILWKDIFNTSLSVFVRSVQWQDILACFIFCLIILGLPKDRQRFSAFGALVGILLWLLPGLVISLSTKYQNDLVPGIAYIPVFFSYFGMGLILYEVSALIGRCFSAHFFRLLLSGAGCMVLLLTMQDNRHIIAMLDDIFLYPRKVGEAALQAGILGESDMDMVISSVPYSLWEHGWLREPYQDKFYSLNARKPVNALGAVDFINLYREEEPLWVTPNNTQLVTYKGDMQGGFAKSGLLKGVGFDFEWNELKDPIVSDVYFFVSGKNQSGVTILYETRDAEWKKVPVEEAWLIRQTPEGTLYKLQEKLPVLFDTIGLLTY